MLQHFNWDNHNHHLQYIWCVQIWTTIKIKLQYSVRIEVNCEHVNQKGWQQKEANLCERVIQESFFFFKLLCLSILLFVWTENELSITIKSAEREKKKERKGMSDMLSNSMDHVRDNNSSKIKSNRMLRKKHWSESIKWRTTVKRVNVKWMWTKQKIQFRYINVKLLFPHQHLLCMRVYGYD